MSALNDSSHNNDKQGKTKHPYATARACVAGAVFVAVGIGLAMHTGTGTLSAFGWNSIAAICPLGALEAMFGKFVFIPRAAFLLAIVIVAVVLTGKAFCGWVCPVPHINNLFSSKRAKRQDREARHDAAHAAYDAWDAQKDAPAERVPRGVKLDSRHGILVGSLASAAVFGFPVFCLVCPVGLSIATFILFWRMVQFNETSWGLLLCPAIIIIEVVVMRRWCSTLCPLGALLSLLSSFNKTCKLSVDHEKCLRDERGVACYTCDAACSEHLDPHSNLGMRDMQECVKCGSCIEACPAKALSFAILPGKKDRQKIRERNDRVRER